MPENLRPNFRWESFHGSKSHYITYVTSLRAFSTISGGTMASNPVDLLQKALTAPINSKEQADILAVLRETLENQPKPIPILLQTLINNLVNAADSLLKRWVLD